MSGRVIDEKSQKLTMMMMTGEEPPVVEIKFVT